MASSPFPINAILTFSVANGQLTVDPNTGNVMPAVEPLTIKAYLKPSNVQGNKAPQATAPGVSAATEEMQGYAVDPMAMPVRINNLAEADAVIDGKSGRFIIRIPTQSAFGVNDVTGDRIYGLFTPDLDQSPPPILPELSFEAAIPLSADRLVALNSDGKLVYADHRYPTLAPIGLTRTAVAVGGRPVIAEEGILNSDGWNFLPPLPLFLGIEGQLTQYAETITTGALIQVGRAVKPNQILLEIEDATILE